jgi:hypothetical protein
MEKKQKIIYEKEYKMFQMYLLMLKQQGIASSLSNNLKLS